MKNCIPEQILPARTVINDQRTEKKQTSQTPSSHSDTSITDTETTSQNSDSGADRKSEWSADQLVRSLRFTDKGLPPLVAAAVPLINLAHTLYYAQQVPDIAELRRAVTDAIKRYAHDLTAAKISPDLAQAAHYVICATLDDVMRNKPWGKQAEWSQSGLVSTFHMSVTGGEHVFELLDHFHKSPETSKDLLLLIYLCLSLAFQGRTRISLRGSLELDEIREDLYNTLFKQCGYFDRELSPHWQGVQAPHRPQQTATVLWTLLSLAAFVLMAGYWVFTLLFNQASNDIFEQFNNVSSQEPASIAVMSAPPEILPQPPIHFPQHKTLTPQAPKPSRLFTLLAALKPEIERGLINLTITDGQLLVRLNNAGLFATAKAEVSPLFRDLLQRIGGALAAGKFHAQVIGYTDSQVIKTARFPSNWHLSAARARAVGDILAMFTGPDTIQTEGRADSNPLANNATPEGRKINRRTEIIILKNPGEKVDELSVLLKKQTAHLSYDQPLKARALQ